MLAWKEPRRLTSHSQYEQAHLNVTAHALRATGNQVVAVVELIIGVAEDGSVARQRPLGVEAHTIEVGVVSATLDECS